MPKTCVLFSVLALAAFAIPACSGLAAAQSNDPGPPGILGGPLSCDTADGNSAALASATAWSSWGAFTRDGGRFTPGAWFAAQAHSSRGRTPAVASPGGRVAPRAARSRAARVRGGER